MDVSRSFWRNWSHLVSLIDATSQLTSREGGEVTKSARMAWVCAEAVDDRTKTACLGFSKSLGARFSSSLFDLAFFGFLAREVSSGNGSRREGGTLFVAL